MATTADAIGRDERLPAGTLAALPLAAAIHAAVLGSPSVGWLYVVVGLVAGAGVLLRRTGTPTAGAALLMAAFALVPVAGIALDIGELSAAADAFWLAGCLVAGATLLPAWPFAVAGGLVVALLTAAMVVNPHIGVNSAIEVAALGTATLVGALVWKRASRLRAGKLQSAREALEGHVEARTRELAESEQRFRALTQVAPVGIFQAAADGQCVYVNDRWCELTGLGPDEALGLGWQRALHPADRDRVIARWASPMRGTPFEGECHYQRPDGAVIRVFTRAAPLRGRSGRIEGYVGAVTDITARHARDEGARRLSGPLAATTGQAFFEAMTAALVDLLGADAAFVTDVTGGRPRVLAMVLDGTAVDDPGAVAGGDAFPPEALAGEARFVGAGAGARHPGTRCLQGLGIEAYATVPLRDPASVVLGALGVLYRRPVPDAGHVMPALVLFAGRTAAELARRQTVRSCRGARGVKEALLKVFHHRVKNNLQIISSLLALQRDQTAEAGARQALRESQNRLRSMALIHERLYQNDHLGAIDLPDYLSRLTDEIRRSYGDGLSWLRLDVDVEPLAVAADDAVPIGLIVTELVTNALKHAFPDRSAGRVTVSLVRDTHGGSLSLSVADDGCGLPADAPPAGDGLGF
ncbi:MAG: sensor histidine kinase, partial [Vicinamibacterales bacterium]